MSAAHTHLSTDRAARLEAAVLARLADGVPRSNRDLRDGGLSAGQGSLDLILHALVRRGQLRCWRIRRPSAGRRLDMPGGCNVSSTVYTLADRPGGPA